jgi:2-methylaconitate cis-trans-isomerase PrpF
MTQLRIPAVYMRGGTSKGVFLRPEDLPASIVDNGGKVAAGTPEAFRE